MKLAFLLASAATLFAAPYQIGSKVDDFRLTDLKGNPVEYSSLKGNVTVVTFISATCPVSNAYNDRMRALFADYSGRGVKFVFVNANQNEPASKVEEHSRSVGFEFPVFKDPNNVVADLFGAQVTPEAFLMDSSGTIRYHGAIDNSQNPARITARSLRDALDAVLAGKAVSNQETKAFGCSIKRVKKTT